LNFALAYFLALKKTGHRANAERTLPARRSNPRHGQPEELNMPVLLLWAVPAVFVIGGLTYVIVK
jgi:hypothetical protein